MKSTGIYHIAVISMTYFKVIVSDGLCVHTGIQRVYRKGY